MKDMSKWIVTWNVRSCMGIEDEGAAYFDEEFDADMFAQEKTAYYDCAKPTLARRIWVQEVA